MEAVSLEGVQQLNRDKKSVHRKEAARAPSELSDCSLQGCLYGETRQSSSGIQEKNPGLLPAVTMFQKMPQALTCLLPA